MCNPEKKEILVPVILYMDGISLDAHGRLMLTPLNMTLGIFNSATRKKPEAWETLYFHPDASFESHRHKHKPTPTESIQNLHNSLHLALKSFRDVCTLPDGIPWDYLPYANVMWQVKMKFAISFVIRDTELHDKLCGSYGSYGHKICMLCRHCNCPTKHTSNPSKQIKYDLWKPQNFDPSLTNEATDDYFQSISHHRIVNAFHKLEFGAYNPHSIHLATPGECLHMHQLGVAKRAIENFSKLLKRKGNREKTGNFVFTPVKALNEISFLAQRYGAMLNRQSDRNFPRTKFATPVTVPAKKEGKDYAGMILTLIIAMLSGKGNTILKQKAWMQNDHIIDA